MARFCSTNTKSKRSLFDKVILNCAGAPSGNIMVVLELAKGLFREEGHQYKGFNFSTLNAQAVQVEYEKAVGPNDCFILICSEKVDKDCLKKLSRRVAIIVNNLFVKYFGPFAGLALFTGVTVLVVESYYMNLASSHQLEICVGIGTALIAKIIEMVVSSN